MAEFYVAVGDRVRRSQSAIEVTNQIGETVAVAEHLLNWVRNH